MSVVDLGIFLRYIVVGIGSNLLFLMIYYGLSLGFGLQHKFSLTLSSGIGFVVSYSANRMWSFNYHGSSARALWRYIIGYLGSFGLQWVILVIGVDFLNFSHVWVVLVGLAVAAIGFFLLQRYWVFTDTASIELSDVSFRTDA